MRSRTLRWFKAHHFLTLVLGAAAGWFAVGCETVEKAPPKPESARVDHSFELEVPQILRGTVASEAVLIGYEPVLVRGYGLVVGLKGTGHRGMPQDLRAHMVAVAQQRGVGSRSSGGGDISIDDLLDSMDTAVVVVEALIPPGAKEGTRFDVRIFAHPQTTPTSLEGGRMYTADLVPGILPGGAPNELPPTGTRQPASLAEAAGPLFINPFAEPGAVERDTINRLQGRILNGGVVLKDIPLELRLATPSHTRARSLQSIINSQFPQEPGQHDPTARGMSDEGLQITVPPSFRDKPADFVLLLRHTTLALGEPELTARAVSRLVQRDPGAAFDASWRWIALGPRVDPIIRELYDYPEEQPRLAALRAGAKLNDAIVVPYLVTMANQGSPASRREAIVLLSDMGVNPKIDQALWKLADDEDVEVRLASYEALVQRRDPFIIRVPVDDKFVIDMVESNKPMIYITQIGEPRIVLFGPDLAIRQPAMINAWSNRLLIKSDVGESLMEVYYRPEDAKQGVIARIKPTLSDFVQYLGHTTTVEQPAPGLGLTYSQSVGALHQIWSQKYINADFKAEQDRILAAILEQTRGTTLNERPEFSENPNGTTAPPPESGGSQGGSGLGGLEPVEPPTSAPGSGAGGKVGGGGSENWR